MTLFSRLVAETGDDYRALAAVPQIRDGLAGRISRETYVAYLTEAYHHVRHTVPLMQAARAGLDQNISSMVFRPSSSNLAPARTLKVVPSWSRQ